MSNNLKFASSVIEFGMLLRNSDYSGNIDFDDVIQMAKISKGVDEEGYRSEFIRLVETYQLSHN